MASETNELTFVRCPTCRSLVPASASRCRICNATLEAGGDKTSATGGQAAGGRVRQKTLSASADDVRGMVGEGANAPSSGSGRPVVDPVSSTRNAQASDSPDDSADSAFDPLGAFLQDLDSDGPPEPPMSSKPVAAKPANTPPPAKKTFEEEIEELFAADEDDEDKEDSLEEALSSVGNRDQGANPLQLDDGEDDDDVDDEEEDDDDDFDLDIFDDPIFDELLESKTPAKSPQAPAKPPVRQDSPPPKSHPNDSHRAQSQVKPAAPPPPRQGMPPRPPEPNRQGGGNAKVETRPNDDQTRGPRPGQSRPQPKVDQAPSQRPPQEPRNVSEQMKPRPEQQRQAPEQPKKPAAPAAQPRQPAMGMRIKSGAPNTPRQEVKPNKPNIPSNDAEVGFEVDDVQDAVRHDVSPPPTTPPRHGQPGRQEPHPRPTPPSREPQRPNRDSDRQSPPAPRADSRQAHTGMQAQARPEVHERLDGERDHDTSSNVTLERPQGGAPRMNKMKPGRLFGWLVSFESPDGRAIELRAGRFFVTGTSIRGTDLILEDQSISTPHALMSINEKGFLLQDLMSERGTFVRSKGEAQYRREEGIINVQHGDWIRFGDVEFLVTIVPG